MREGAPFCNATAFGAEAIVPVSAYIYLRTADAGVLAAKGM
jgi:hypothetical protein